MKGLLERSREDAKLLLSKLGFAVTVPLAGYLAVNPNLSSSSSPAMDESGAVVGDSKSLKEEIHVRERASDSKSTIHATTSGCKNLKDEIHIQESEEALAKIIHGTSAIKEHFACTQLLLPKHETSLMRLIHTELDAKQVEMEQEIEERERNHFLEYCLSKDQQAVVRELEDQLKISMMKASNLALKLQSMNQQNNQLRIETQHSGIISEIEHVRMIIHYLIKALKSDWLHSGQKIAVLEQEITLSGNKNDEEQKADTTVVADSKLLELEDERINVRENILSLEQKSSESAGERKDDTKVEAESKMPKELNDESINLRENFLSSEFKNSELVVEQKDDTEVETNSRTLMEVKDECIKLGQMTEFVGMLNFENNMASFPCTPMDQEVEEELEANCANQNEREREIEQPHDDHHNAEFLENLYDGQINSWLKYEKSTCDSCTQKSTESCINESLTAKTQRKTEEVVRQHTYMGIDLKNKYSKDIDTENCSSLQINNESMSCSSDISSVTSNSSIVRSKNHSAHRTKVFSKLKKMFFGKHSNRKGKLFANKTPTDSASSYTKQSFSTSCLEDMSRNSCHSDHSFSSQTTTTKHSVETGGDRWHSNSAWYQSFYRTPFDVSRAKVFAVQEDVHAFCQGNKGNPIISNEMVNRDDMERFFLKSLKGQHD